MKHVAWFVGTAMSVGMLGCSGAGAEGAEGSEEVTSETREDLASTEAAAVDEKDPVTEKGAATDIPTVRFIAAEGCSGVAGTWRGQVFSQEHGGYYEFTAHVAQASYDDSVLSGTIVARSWGGQPSDVAPPDTCGDGFHFTVVEQAEGRVEDDGSMSFAASAWQMGERLCGGDVTDYSPDRLSSLKATDEGSAGVRLTGVVSDGALWADGRPIEMTRIACE